MRHGQRYRNPGTPYSGLSRTLWFDCQQERQMCHLIKQQLSKCRQLLIHMLLKPYVVGYWPTVTQESNGKGI